MNTKYPTPSRYDFLDQETEVREYYKPSLYNPPNFKGWFVQGHIWLVR